MKVRLVSAVRLSDNTPLRKPGEVVDLSDSDAERLIDLGAAVEDVDKPESNTADPVEVSPEEVAEPVVAPVSDRPARTASIDTWRAYAQSNDLDPKGLSKQEIIAAVG